MSSANATQQVLVTYAAPQAFLASGSWGQIHASLLAQLPLRNIHWKSSGHSVLRTIQELNFILLQFEPIRDELASQIPVTILDKPLLNIYIVTCEDTDVEAYRLVHKKQVKDWLNIVASRKNQDWLLLHLVKQDVPVVGGKLFQLKGSVLERMRADFNVDKRDRCVQITWAPGTEGSAALWAEFLNKVKDGLIYAFDSAISQREDEVKRSESQRQMPGWNFCTYFILKESLSNSFEGMNLFEEALLHYDELEETFTHVLKEKNLSWFGSLINPHPLDDSSPLLSSTKKPYRDLILANNISVFDLCVYLLARRCELLARLGGVSEAARKVKTFLIFFARQLREIDATLPKLFIESWLYSSALSVADQCDEWMFACKIEESQLVGYYAVKGELLELAQIQLNSIGTRLNYLPSRSPFLMGPQHDSVTSSGQQIANADVHACINDAEFFYDLYTRVTNRAIEMYARAKRRKFALKLYESLAALDAHRGRLAAALTTYSSLPVHYAPYTWSSLESFTLLRALDAHAELQKTKDTEWIHILLAFLKTIAEWPEVYSFINRSNRIEYISSLLQSLKSVSSTLESDITQPDHPAFTVKIADKVRIAGSEDGVYLDITIQNHLPCNVPIDEITTCVSGRDPESLLFSAKVNELTIGRTTIALFCPISCAGTYALESCEIRIGLLKLRWSYKKQGQRGMSPPHNPVLIHVPPDPHALDVQALQPTHIKLGHPPSLLIIISTGRNNTSKIALKLAAAGISFRFERAMTMEGPLASLRPPDLRLMDMYNMYTGSVTPVMVENAVTYSNVSADTAIKLQVPYDDNSSARVLKILVDLSYTTTSEPNVTRTLRTTRIVTTVLPFSVNVEDFFRGKSLISKFTISTATHQHIRIASVRLEGPRDAPALKVVSCPTKRDVMTIRPGQPTHSLFRLDSGDGPVREQLVLVVQYRMLREEVEELVQNSVQGVLEMELTTSDPHDSSALVKKLVEALERDAGWVGLYELTGGLVVPRFHCEHDDALLQSVKQRLESHQHPPQPDGTWRVMRIPVDVPQMHIVAAARISINTVSRECEVGRGRTLYAGQPIPANLTIRTSFHWGIEKRKQYTLRFDIEELVKDWLISGHKRGDFIAKDDGVLNVPLTMIALHHGELPLPKVTVSALPISSEMTMGSPIIPSIDTHQIHGAEKVLVLPRGGKNTFVVGMGPERFEHSRAKPNR